MKLCKDCKNHNADNWPGVPGYWVCEAYPENSRTNFVSGKVSLPFCESMNTTGDCPRFVNAGVVELTEIPEAQKLLINCTGEVKS